MLAMIEKGDWLYSFDLKAGYHHVDIRESYQTFGFFLQACDSAPAGPKIVLVPRDLYIYVCPHLEDDHAAYTCCIGRMHSLATTFSPHVK